MRSCETLAARARLVEQNALDPELPDAMEVIKAVMSASWEATPPRDPYLRAILVEVEWRVLRGLMSD